MSEFFDTVLWFREAPDSLKSGTDIWYEIFIWCLFSSLFIYSIAAVGAFLTLRKHKLGRYVHAVYFISTGL